MGFDVFEKMLLVKRVWRGPKLFLDIFKRKTKQKKNSLTEQSRLGLVLAVFALWVLRARF